jgi:uncharacterized protein YigE (DUF2233 family)
VTNAGRRFTVCRVDVKQERLQLFLNDARGQPLKSYDGVNRFLQPTGRRLTFAMNAGMYHPDLSPVGLCIADGRSLAPLNLKDGDGNFYLKPNGVFLLTSAGARVVDSADYSKVTEPVQLATQSGPLLVGSGRIHPRFNSNSTSRLIRNGVGVRSTQAVVFAISDEPVTFHEFAIFFRDALGCQDALYLDGVISSLHGSPSPRNDRKVDLGPIIGLTN